MSKRPVKLLLVEDNIDQKDLTVRVFRRKDPTVEVTAVENGPASLELLSQGHFDAVILDYSLPQMDGLEVLSQIRERGYIVPVIMVTGQGDENIAVEAMKRGAYDYIIKTENYQETLPMVVEKVVEKYKLKRHLEEVSLRNRRLYEVSLSVAMQRKVEILAEVLVEGAKQLMQAEGAIFFLVNEEEEILLSNSSGFEIDRRALQGPITSTGLFGLAYSERWPVSIENAEQHSLLGSTPVHRPLLRRLLSAPLIRQEKVRGVLTVVNKEGGEPFTSGDIDVLSTLAVHAAAAIDNVRFLEEMEKQAITDSLTGFYNHREFQKRLLEEVDRSSRYGKEFSLLMLDIDHFKVLNDTHGHPAGDTILQQIVKIIRKCIRNVDLPARYGGEEFTIILPETPGDKAKTVAERIRKSIAEHPFATPAGSPAHISVSIGVASFPYDVNKREELIIAADEALYFAKNAGRNTVCRYSETLKSAIERDQSILTHLLEDPQLRTVKDLAEAIDAKSPYTRGHTEGVIQYAVRLAEALNLSESDKKNLQFASLLHNIGMVSVPDTLLNKPGPLSVEERKIIQGHPALAQMLVKGSIQLESILPAILYHHERYDGKGYPNGLKGEEIPFLARVLGVVEAYHAMISVRPYRPKMTQQEAVEELKRNAGTQFDPHVIKTFVRLLNEQS